MKTGFIFFLHLLLCKLKSVCSFSIQSTWQLDKAASRQQLVVQVATITSVQVPNNGCPPSLFLAMPYHDQDLPSKKSLDDQPYLQKFYYGISSLYCAQVLFSLKKYYGLSLKGFNAILGPFMAAGIAYILGRSAKNKFLGLDTFKRLNGLLFLFPQISLAMLVLISKKSFESDGILLLISSFLAIFVSTKGYLLGLQADGDKAFLPETLRLFHAAASLTMSLSPKTMTYSNFFRLVTIAIHKAVLVGGILKVLWFGDGILFILPRLLAQLGKLTLLGGSIVTFVSVEPNEMARDMTAGPINFMAFMAFLFMSVYSLAKASSTLELADGLLLSVCAMCSAFEGLNNQSSKRVVAPKDD